MSLFCVVPASAASLKLELPYVFEDFEDRAQSVSVSEYSAANEGYNSKYAGVYKQNSKDKNFYLNDADGAKQSITLAAGEKLEVSFMLKLGQTMSRAGACLIVRNATEAAWEYVYCDINTEDTTNWQEVSFEYSAETETELSQIALRFSTSAGDNLATDDTAVTDSTKVYYVDNYEVKVVPASIESEVVPFENFDDNSAARGQASITDEGTGYGDTGRAGRYTWSTNGDKWIYRSGSTHTTQSFAAGDTVKLSMRIKLGQALKEGRAAGVYLNIRYSNNGTKYTGPVATITDIDNTTDWQYIEGTYTFTEAVEGQRLSLRFGAGLNAYNLAATDTAIGDSTQVYYVDDLSITLTSAADLANVAKVTDAAATRKSETEIGLGYTFTNGLTDASIVKLVATEGTTKSYLYTYQASEFASDAAVALPTGTESKNLSLEIVPVASNGYVGETVTVEVPAYQSAPAIEGITLTQAEGSVTVATDTALTNAQLIFVTYDANNKMVDWEAVSVTLAAQKSNSYAPADLTVGSYTKAMLWQDMTKCVPLADMIRY